MKKLLATIALLLSATAQASNLNDWLAANDVRPEVSIGLTQFGKTENGIWYQNGFDHALDLNSTSWAIGVSGKANDWMRWRAQWSRLGNMSTHARATQYDPMYNGVNGCVDPCNCNIQTFTTTGSLQGLSLTLAPEMHIYGGVKGFVEAGVFYNLTKFRAETGTDINHIFWANEYREGWNLGTQLGAGLEYKSNQVVLTYHKADAPTKDPNAIIARTGEVWNLSLRHRF